MANETKHQTWLSSEENARLLLENIKDYAIYILDLEGNVVSWAPGAERVKGYPMAEVLGKHFSMFFTPEDRDAAEPDRELLAATQGRVELEGWRVRKDGTRFWADVTMAPMRDETGEIRGFVKVTRDLTDRHEREEQRVQLAKTEEILRLQNDFLARARTSVDRTLVTLRVHLQSLIGAVDATGEGEVRAKLRMLDWGLDRMVRSIEEVVALAEETTAKLRDELAAVRPKPRKP